jgi:hypothetical protein
MSGIVEWGTRDGSEIARRDGPLRLVEDSPGIARSDKTSLTQQRRSCRFAHTVPTDRNDNRLVRFAF